MAKTTRRRTTRKKKKSLSLPLRIIFTIIGILAVAIVALYGYLFFTA